MDIGVYKAISAVQSELAGIGISKDKKNAQQGYNFRGIDDVYGALAPILAKHSLCILPRVLSREVVERQTKSGGALFYVTVGCEFDMVSAMDGSKHTVATYGEAMDSGDKATNKAMSAAYKYAAFQTFCIPVDVEDADATTHEVKPKALPPKPSPKPPVSAPAEKPEYPEFPEPEKDPLPVGTELRTRVDGMIADNGIDAKEFKAWLASIGKIGKKYGNPSLSTMKVKDAEAMLTSWEKTVKAFNLYIDKKAT